MLSAQTILNRIQQKSLIIAPFYPTKELFNGRTFGLSSCGYDIRLDQDLLLCPGYGRLGSALEYIKLPNDLSAEVKDKSTNARLFILVQNTIIEPGWGGHLTLELTRFLPWPIRVRRGTPIAQIVFHQLDEPTEMPYKGKYNNQGSQPQKALFER
jgi:dCTP deaminase